jgi:nucleoside-diphosphate-sugar epimerase
MHTILGAGGAIGTELAKALRQYTQDIKLVSRNPKRVNETDIVHAADLSDATQLKVAIQGSTVCYLTVGFDYNTKLWQQRWIPLVTNVVQVCSEYNAKLVFFDNVYAIGGDNIRHITEDSPISPSSKKGHVRAGVDRVLLEAMEQGKVEAIIARAPDFFGPIKEKSLVMNLIYDNLVKGKSAQWFCNADVPHSVGFTPDLAQGTALLGNTPDAYNQVWNLPVDSYAPTGRQWAALFAKHLGLHDPERTAAKIQVLPAWALKLLGIVVPILGEMYEMRYQYDREYIFDSSKFIKKFSFTPTRNDEAVRQTVEALQRE